MKRRAQVEPSWMLMSHWKQMLRSSRKPWRRRIRKSWKYQLIFINQAMLRTPLLRDNLAKPKILLPWASRRILNWIRPKRQMLLKLRLLPSRKNLYNRNRQLYLSKNQKLSRKSSPKKSVSMKHLRLLMAHKMRMLILSKASSRKTWFQIKNSRNLSLKNYHTLQTKKSNLRLQSKRRKRHPKRPLLTRNRRRRLKTKKERRWRR